MAAISSAWNNGLLVTCVTCMFLAATSCSKKEASVSTPYELQIPPFFPKPFLNASNPMTVEGIYLGRRLFYDTRLSSNGRSCNSCHLQNRAFMVPNSLMGLDPVTYNNIPSLVNLAWKREFGWKGEHPDLDHVAIGDFGPLFFNSDIDKVMAEIGKDAEYKRLFALVFPGQEVFHDGKFQEKTAFAIAQFLRSIVSAGSRFDRVMAGELKFTPEEEYGFDLFRSERGDCFHCHAGRLLSDQGFHNNGLDADVTGTGRFLVTGQSQDYGKYATPSLRNVALTGPYMHDGRFNTLDEVLDFYNSGVKPTATLDPIMTKNGRTTGLNLSGVEIRALKAFLMTLTDSSLLGNKAYGRPD